MKSICVYCGSNAGGDPAYAAEAKELGARLAAEKLALVYGGGNVGLMGIVADAVLEHGGEVIGVIPQQLVDWEVAHKGVTRLEIVDSMHTRKARMFELSDGFIALPGGF
ncbi:MAG TPA: TIGR00730 family Rossman fold protein, partial [Pseudoxanthomonas sp.]|nr:TIGR00730 family Rossman fold protein [Pseudoxanthomonas sp.]